ncbi:MAG: adenylate/guanylate cyclase domain-containing protein [Alphaproteobacteria bacterium]|nr:adenylate/guanylate cyclase domain-containing protein [Alphaproteobacteria bacterium]
MTISPVPRSDVRSLLLSLRTSRLADEARAARNPHLQAALVEDKRIGMAIAVWARTAALVVIALMLPFVNPRWEVLFYEALVGAFVALGWWQLRVARVGQSRAELLLIIADLLLLALTLLVPNPFVGEPWPTAMQYRWNGFIYFFVLLAAATLAYSWRTVATIGLWTALAWLIAAGLLAAFGTTLPGISEAVAAALPAFERIRLFLDPNAIMFEFRVQEAVVFFLVATILALKSRRANQLLFDQAELAAERANLSRYFPPTLVDELAQKAKPFGDVRSQEIAVLFADIVGFTRFAESHPPAEVVGVLRRYHALLEHAVFANHGTLDKFLGDGVMTTFGTPTPTANDAANAVQCGLDILRAVDAWNAERQAAGQPPIRVSIGLHYGPAILGDIGSERRLEFATLGDTVNVASRLEGKTRALDCRLLASEALIGRLGEGRARLTATMKPSPGLRLRGRALPLDAWAV